MPRTSLSDQSIGPTYGTGLRDRPMGYGTNLRDGLRGALLGFDRLGEERRPPNHTPSGRVDRTPLGTQPLVVH